MSISAEWGVARDTTITAAGRGCRPAGMEGEVTEAAALIFDPQSGGAFVLEGTPTTLVARLDQARRALTPLLAAEVLADWHEYTTRHAEIMHSGEEQAGDEYEDHHLPELARRLAEALQPLAGR